MTSPRTEEWDACLMAFEGHKLQVNMVTVLTEGSRAASASDDGNIIVWDTSNGSQVACLEGHKGPVKAVEYSPDSSLIASGGSDATVRIWDAITGVNISTWTSHKNAINTVVFSNDGQYLVSGSADSTIQIWEVATSKHIATLQEHSDAVTCLVFLPNDYQILSSSMDCTIRLWDIKLKSVMQVLHCPDAVLSLAVSPASDKHIFLSGSQEGTITMWNFQTFEKTGYFVEHTAEVNSLAFEPYGEKIVSGSADGTICIWSSVEQSHIAKCHGHTGPIQYATFTPDGAYIFSASTDRTIRMWDSTVEGVQGAKDYVLAVAIANNLEHIISGSTDGKMALWKTVDGSLVYEHDVHDGNINGIAITNDDTLVGSAGSDGTVCVVNVLDGTIFTTFKGHTNEVYSTDFFADGSHIISSSGDGHIRLWNINAKKYISSFVHNDRVYCAWLSPDDKLICSGTMPDNVIHIWNVETGDEIAVLKDFSSSVLWVLFAPSGKHIVAWFADDTIRMWSAQDEEFKPLPFHEWRYDQPSNSDDQGGLITYGELFSTSDPHYLQEDGWVTLPEMNKRTCWVPPSRRIPWPRTFWQSQGGLFVTGSQTGSITIVDLRSSLV
jgi:WD40 repeat protein